MSEFGYIIGQLLKKSSIYSMTDTYISALPSCSIYTARMYECKAKEESRKCGLLMEWIWHYIFGEEAIQAPYLKPLIPLLSQSDRISLHRRPSCLA